MKKLFLIFTALVVGCLSFWAFVNMSPSSFEVPIENITFHKVNLVCGAANDIGCGSRSKPILLDLEKEGSIDEAWLNRSGTIVGIVWKKGVEPNVKSVPAIFKKHGISMKTLTKTVYKEQLQSFKSDKWYKGTAVDELSMEEAGRIASQIIDPMVEDGTISKENSLKMFTEVEKYIQNEFMILEDVSLLSTTAYYDQWEKEIEKIGVKYIPKEKMPKIEMCGGFSSWWISIFN